ncbi:ABC-three component system middle component 1 [Streptococcus pseudopneumoniae]|uniref:ABC-three component system middle component 1 n=1 Tax=Streptococcus pseudopneumoniae TaxID=257758 RepID=UPI00066CAAC7|nr:ABC-three component system middle component 1 [Streptococcus pseudopneumoniae]
MRDIVIKFLQNNHFNQLDTELDFYTNPQNSEYFILSQYSPNELHNFFDDDKTSQVIKEFERLSVKSEHENIKKNTSLFILVEVDDLKAVFEDEKVQRTILLIEEDYYYFRKLIILYTRDGLLDLRDKETNEMLYTYLDSNIDLFEKDMFFSESYFIAMEIGVKLPFFTLPKRNDIYQSIENQYQDDNDELDNRLLDFYTKVTDEILSESLKDISTDDDNISDLLQIGELLP